MRTEIVAMKDSCIFAYSEYSLTLAYNLLICLSACPGIKKTARVLIAGPLREDSVVTRGFHNKGPVMKKGVHVLTS